MYASYSSETTPGRPSEWSRTVPQKIVSAPQSGRGAHSITSSTGSGSSDTPTQSRSVGLLNTRAIVPGFTSLWTGSDSAVLSAIAAAEVTTGSLRRRKFRAPRLDLHHYLDNRSQRESAYETFYPKA